jgi:hypothetical protein
VQGGERLKDDAGTSKSLKYPVLSPVRQGCEQERVKREPEAHPHQHPSSGIENEVGIPAAADQARLHDDEKKAQNGNRNSNPQLMHTIETGGSTLTLVIGDSMVAVTVEGATNSLVQPLLDLMRRQYQFDRHWPTRPATSQHADAVLQPCHEVAILGEQIGLCQSKHVFRTCERQRNDLGGLFGHGAMF